MNPNDLSFPTSRTEAFQRLGELEQELRGLLREIRRNHETLQEWLASRSGSPSLKECYKSVTNS